MSRALLAVVAVAAAAFGTLTAVVVADPRPALDDAVWQLIDHGAPSGLVALANGPLDVLAAPGTVIVLAVLAGGVLAHRGRWAAVSLLAIGLSSTGVLGTILKELIERPRPLGNLDEGADNFAYPSGHARFGFFWIWLAVTVVVERRVAGPARLALLTAGVLVTAATGLARVYLRAHWLTDVLGGWTLSLLTFASATLLVRRRARRHQRVPGPRAVS